MMKSRQSYGWGRRSTAATPKATQQKYEVCYHDEWGGFGIVGWKLFNTVEEAEAFAETFQQEHDYVTDTFIRHPSAIYSNY